MNIYVTDSFPYMSVGDPKDHSLKGATNESINKPTAPPSNLVNSDGAPKSYSYPNAPPPTTVFSSLTPIRTRPTHKLSFQSKSCIEIAASRRLT